MTVVHLVLYRISFVFEDLGAKLASWRLPRAVRIAKHTIHKLFRRFVLTELSPLVQVQSGLSRGMWIRVRLPEEASYWRGQRERALQDAISSFVREGSVVYDVGSHIGVVALGTARLAGKTGCVVAFDGDPDNAARLRENCLLNKLETRVRVVHAAVWSYTESNGIWFRRGATRRSHGGVEADGHHPVLAAGPVIKVPAITLDDFVRSEGPPPELVKIDVEGGEYEVLRGGEILFTERRPRIIVEVHHHDALEQILNWLERVRYCARWEIPEQEFPRVLFGWPAESDHL